MESKLIDNETARKEIAKNAEKIWSAEGLSYLLGVARTLADFEAKQEEASWSKYQAEAQTRQQISAERMEEERTRAGLDKTNMKTALGITPRKYNHCLEEGDWPCDVLLKMSKLYKCSVGYLIADHDRRELT